MSAAGRVRVGHGFDVHAFDPSRPLIVGGITIPGAAGLAGHSDADVLSHAIADALLGASGLGDLGTLCPPTERWKDAAGTDILQAAASLLREEGWSIGNVDGTIVAQGPRMAPFKDAMRSAIATALAVSEDVVSVKATTTDELGAIGRGDGMAAFAVALVTGT